jgi:glycosyltransferase involved in cell wall biosynthesis
MKRSNKLSILIITPWYGSEERNGVAVAVENLVHGLISLGLRPFVFRIVGDGWLPRCKRGGQGELVIYLPIRPRSEATTLKPFFGYWLRFALVWIVLAPFILASRCSLMNFHYYSEQYEDLRKIARAFRKRVVTTFHGSDIMVAANENAMREGTRRLIHDSSRVTTVSKALLNELRCKYPECAAKSEVIPNAIDAGFLKAALAVDSSIPTDIDLLFVGGLLPVKGLDLLLDAFEKVLKQRPYARLCLVGAGSMERELTERIQSQHWEENVRLLGLLPHLRLVERYNRTKVVVMPSRSEGLPLVAMEAALVGKPVVAFGVGGISEIVVDGKTGIVVAPHDVSELADAMIKLLEQPNLAVEMGAQARARALSLFDPSVMAARYGQLYEEVMTSS